MIFLAVVVGVAICCKLLRFFLLVVLVVVIVFLFFCILLLVVGLDYVCESRNEVMAEVDLSLMSMSTATLCNAIMQVTNNRWWCGNGSDGVAMTPPYTEEVACVFLTLRWYCGGVFLPYL